MDKEIQGTASDQVTALPGLRELEGVQFSGYASVNGVNCQPGTDESLFYWFAGSDDYASRPTILWTNGGPGSSSFWGFFLENGPYEVGNGASYETLDPGTVTARPMGWNTQANYLIFEHPLTVTLSFPNNEANVPTDVKSGIEQFYQALQSFMDKHPELRDSPLLLAGESYGGTYVPLLANAISQGMKAGDKAINLVGQILISGWVNPLVQQSMDSTYAFNHGLIDEAGKAEVDQLYEACAIEINKTAPGEPTSKAAADACGKVLSKIKELSGRSYMLNILQEGDPGTSNVQTYLNRDDVRKAIHVPPVNADKTNEVTAFSSNTIYSTYQVGMENSYAPLVENLVNQGLKTMVISGLSDGTDVNFMGVGAWIKEMKGAGFTAFQSATKEPWTSSLQQQPLGWITDGDSFSWVKVVGGGHLSVRDQPQLIDLIMERFANVF